MYPTKTVQENVYMYIIHNDMFGERERKEERKTDMKIEGKNDDIKTNWEHFI